MDLELSGKVAVVTGGSRGIGKAIARELALEGVDLALVARDRSTLDVTCAELAAASGRRAEGFVADTTDAAAVQAMGRAVLETFGRVDILVNSAARPAGQAPPVATDAIDAAAFDDEMHTKVLGYLRCAQEFAPGMKERGWGRIVNISGLGAYNTGSVLGSVRNVAVIALAKNLADELGPFGVNVTVVHPGTTRTEATPDVMAARAARQGVTVEEVERRVAAGTSVNRFLDAREVAWVVVFLCSPKAIAINGDVISAGGGTPGVIRY